MQTRKLGNTGLEVTAVGLGAAEIGFIKSEPGAAGRVLNGVLDAGVNLIDTSACYADSEVKIGEAISSRRDEYVLVTKCGHKVEGLEAEEWTADAVRESVERSLKRLKTDHVDVMLLHSCSTDQLADDAMIGALVEARRAGKTRHIGYSGDGASAAVAVGMDFIEVLETSVSFCDQQCLTKYLPQARSRGIGVIAKRSIANGCWRDASNFDEFYTGYIQPYVERLAAMDLTPEAVGFDGSFVELALRFSAHSDGVDTIIVGSTNVEHTKSDLEIVGRGPLPDEVYEKVRELWNAHDDGSWVGQI